MNTDSADAPQQAPDVGPTPMQLAIRQRAQETLDMQQARHRTPRSRWLFGIACMLLMVLLFVFTVDVSVRTMHTIIDILLPHKAPPPPADLKQPYFIAVDPEAPATEKPPEPKVAAPRK